MIWGYVFHSWELLGMWAWTPAFVAAALAGHGTPAAQAAGFGASLSALFHVMGIVASAVGGTLSDRWGRTAVIAGMMLVSSACSFGFGWMLTAPLVLIIVVGSVYGFSALGDSAPAPSPRSSSAGCWTSTAGVRPRPPAGVGRSVSWVWAGCSVSSRCCGCARCRSPAASPAASGERLLQPSRRKC